MKDKTLTAQITSLVKVLSTVAEEDGQPVPENILYVFMMDFMDLSQFDGLLDKLVEVGFFTRSNHTVSITAEGKISAAKADAAIAQAKG